MKEYINLDREAEVLYEIYKEKVDDYLSDPDLTEAGRYYLETYWDSEQIMDYAMEVASTLNENMKDYLNQKDHHMAGNFMNIDYDYPRFRECKPAEERGIVADMIKRLNDGDTSKQSDEDRDYLTDWLMDAFGTFGLSYNFGSVLSEGIYAEEEIYEEDK